MTGAGGGQGSRVAVARCDAYAKDIMRSTVESMLEALGGIGAFVHPGERIALKPNLLLAKPPQEAITTHPYLVEVVAELVREAGGEPVLIESSAAGMPQFGRGMERVLRKTGMREMADRIGLEVDVGGETRTVSQPEARLTKRLDLLTSALDADGLISLAKFKTHTFTTFTGAVKNLFGCVPGLTKAGYHAKLSDVDHFADMLLDVHQALRPRLSLMDGILALEGDGPGTGGTPRELGLLLASADALALDAVACQIAGIPEEAVPVFRRARVRGYRGWETGEAEIVLQGLDRLPLEPFRRPKRALDPTGYNTTGRLQRIVRELGKQALTPRPRPSAERCTGCRTCSRACPVEAIQMSGRLAIVADDRCIRCYCCHELCPEAAIDLELSRLGRVAERLGLV
ncbi:MAG TPA: DUF362 domain-containing protein [Thermoleophilia bacterium]|nr:DUF362 domain-containing protein [Thermoleophilia bacterium]